MRAIVTCECCGHKMAVLRPIPMPETFWIICHECEGVLRIEVDWEDIRLARIEMIRNRRRRIPAA